MSLNCRCKLHRRTGEQTRDMGAEIPKNTKFPFENDAYNPPILQKTIKMAGQRTSQLWQTSKIGKVSLLKPYNKKMHFPIPYDSPK